MSFEITAWAGMSTTSTRRLTLTTRSTPGIRTMIPGPLAPAMIRPNRKNTPRSYSGTTMRMDRTPITNKMATITITTAITPPADEAASRLM